MTDSKRSKKHEHARNTLPDELKPVFDELVEDYPLATTVRYAQGYISFIVLADLIRVG